MLQAGQHSEAVHAYQDTLAARGASAPSSSRLYLQLAQAYEALGFPDYALAVYTQVSCKLHRGAASCSRRILSALKPEHNQIVAAAALLFCMQGR